MIEHWLQLSLTEGLGPILTGRLVEALGSAERACSASAEQLRQVEGIGAAKGRAIQAALREARGAAEAEIERARALGVALVCPDDDAYPEGLRAMGDPPAVLYVKGSLEPRDLNALAVVGSRKCSHYGREQAERFGALLAGAGFTVVSGGARGVDSAAHLGAMRHPHGRTVAVLGTGVDRVYPPENAGLFDQIAARGALVSEFPLGTPPLRDNFPRRNRIIAGLSRGVLVVEADARSGSLITARQAGEDYGRPVFAMPGRVDNPLSAGPHQLIRDGATLVTNLEEILDDLGPLPAGAAEARPQSTREATPGTEAQSGATPAPLFAEKLRARPGEGSVGAGTSRGAEREERPEVAIGLTDRQRAVLGSFGPDPAAVDQLIERTGLAAQEVLQELTLLSLRGLVRRVDGNTYARANARAR